MEAKTPKSIETEAVQQAETVGESLGIERLVFFSDAVFAIAITLLALEIRLPSEITSLDNAQLADMLLGLWHKYLAYVISFLVIGLFWSGHHRKFRLIQRYDNRLIFINLLALMMVAFVPFPSSVLSDSSNRTATIFYALTMVLVALFYAALWWYAAWGNRLVDPHLDAHRRMSELLASLSTAVIFAISIGLAFIDPDLARLSWLFVFPISLYINRN